MLAETRNTCLTFLVVVFMIGVPTSETQAQLNEDPAKLPFPDLSKTDPDRAVVVSVTFNSPTQVVAGGVIVSNTRAKSSLGAPPLILLELLDENDAVLTQQHSWHPLWVRDLNEGNGESTPENESGPGTFYVPFDEDLRSVRITDIELGVELITVDVSDEVAAFCARKPTPVLCVLFRDGFEKDGGG